MLLDAYTAYAAKLETIFQHDRTKTVGASEIGQCARKVFWIKKHGTKAGAPIDEGFEHDWGARVRGTIMEAHFWEPALRDKYGDKLLFAGKEQRTLQTGYLSGTPDGMLVDQPYDLLKHLGVRNIKTDCVMVEGKTIDPRTNLVEAKEQNYFQTQVQMGLTRELTPYQPHYNLLTYTDASFYSEVLEFPIEFDLPVYEAAKQRAKDIITGKHGRDFKPEGWIAGGKECRFCPYTKACGVERRGVPYNSKQATPQFAAEITDLAREANKASAAMTKAQKQFRALQDEIKGRLRAKRVKRIEGVVNWYATAEPRRWNNKGIRERLVEMGEDLSEFEEIGEPSDRLVIAANPAVTRVVKKKRAARSVKQAKVSKANGKRKQGKRKQQARKRTRR